jgi:hypothetical protein
MPLFAGGCLRRRGCSAASIAFPDNLRRINALVVLYFKKRGCLSLYLELIFEMANGASAKALEKRFVLHHN